MSKSGGTGGYVKPPTGRLFALGGEGAASASAPGNGVMRLYAIFNPFAVPITGFGFSVTTAGAAGATLVPVVFGPDANGDPGHPLVIGNPVAADVIAQAFTAFAGTIPYGHLWVGSLSLTPGAAPTCDAVTRSDQDPRGAFAACSAAGGVALLPAQTGLGAIPDPAVVTYNAPAAPILYART